MLKVKRDDIYVNYCLRSRPIYNTRISRLVTIVTRCHNCDMVCHNCDILFVKMLELGSEIIPKN